MGRVKFGERWNEHDRSVSRVQQDHHVSTIHHAVAVEVGRWRSAAEGTEHRREIVDHVAAGASTTSGVDRIESRAVSGSNDGRSIRIARLLAEVTSKTWPSHGCVSTATRMILQRSSVLLDAAVLSDPCFEPHTRV